MLKLTFCEREKKSCHTYQKSLSVCSPPDQSDKLHTTQEAVTSMSCTTLVCQQTAVSEDDKDL